MAKRVCPCYRQKPQWFGMLGVGIWKYATLGAEHYQLANGDVCHDRCKDQGYGYCTDEVYVDTDVEEIFHTWNDIEKEECNLPIPKRAWIHCDV